MPSVVSTVSQVKVDQGLIREAFCFGQGLEVVDGAAIDVDGDLLLQQWMYLPFCFHTDTQ